MEWKEKKGRGEEADLSCVWDSGGGEVVGKKREGVRRGEGWMGVHIHPFAGGLRAMVPAPRGIRAVGEGDVPERRELEREERLGVAGEVGERVEEGEMGFMRSPLRPGADFCGIGGWLVGGGPGTAERGVGGRIFSRWSWR